MEYDYYPESALQNKDKKKISVKKIIKYTMIGIVVLVYLVIFVRIFIINNSPDMASSYLWTDKSLAAYNADHDSLKVQDQQIRSFTITNPDGSKDRIVYNDITSDGYYKISNFMYNENTKELMISIRLSDVSLENAQKKLSLSEKPEPGDFIFAIESTDGYVYKYRYTYKKSAGYHFFRLVFDDIDLSKYPEVSLNVYYARYMVLDDPLGTLTVYDSRIPVSYADTRKLLPAEKNGDLKESPYTVPVK